MESRRHRISHQATPEWTAAAPAATPQCAGVGHVGVVFVHGVGFQEAGETLLNWSDPIIRILREHRVPSRARSDPVIDANLNFTAGTELPFIEVSAPDRKDPRHWIFAEAFWASSIEPPSVGTVLDWLGSRQGATRAVDHLLRGSRSVFSRAVKRLFVAGLGSMLLVVYAAMRAVLSIIPGTGLKQTVFGPIDALLTAWTGDMRTLLSDPAQSRAVRDRIASVILGLQKKGCTQIVVLAHSGGAVATYLTLAERPTLPVTKVVTFGEGLRIAWRLLDVENFPPYPAGLLAKPMGAPPPLWFDYWASDDPVPAGGLDRASPGRPSSSSLPVETLEIGNRWSFRQDHGTYWENDEEFTIPVIRHIDRPMTNGDNSTFYTSSQRRQQNSDQRYRRLGILGFWRSFIFAAAFAAIGIGSAGAAYHVYAKPYVDEAVRLDRPAIDGLVDAWDAYRGRDEDLTYEKRKGQVGGPLLDTGMGVATVWSSLPGTGILSGPVELVRRAASDNIFLIAGVVMGFLVWPLLIALASFNAWPRERWAEKWVGPGSTILWWLGVMVAAPLVIGTAFAVVGLVALGFGSGGPAIWAALIVLGVWFLVWLVTRRRRIFLRSWQLLTPLGVALCLLLATVVNRAFGAIVVGSAVVLLIFVLIGSLGEWRWRARDEHERRAVRTGRSPRFPLWWDAAVGSLLLVCALLMLVAMAWASIGGNVGGIVVLTVALALLAVLLGIQLDQFVNERPVSATDPPS